MWRGYNVYLCAPPVLVEQCETDNFNLMNRVFGTLGAPCGDWGQVTKTTGLYEPDPHYLTAKQQNWWEKVSIQRDHSMNQNPVTMSLQNVIHSYHSTKTISVLMGVDVWGTDPVKSMTINILSYNHSGT